jgi:uncharacterized repeat protein (TIGR01451 family)
MQNSVWKLTALTGVVGLVLLVLVQAQRGMNQPSLDDEFNAVAGDLKPGEEGTNFDLGDATAFDASDQYEPGGLFSDEHPSEPMNDRFMADPPSETDGGLDFRDGSDDPTSGFPDDSNPRFVRDAEPPRGLDSSSDSFDSFSPLDDAPATIKRSFDSHPLADSPSDPQPTITDTPRGLFDDPPDFADDSPRRDPAVIPAGNVDDIDSPPAGKGTGPRLLAPDSAKPLAPTERSLPDFAEFGTPEEEPFAADKNEPTTKTPPVRSIAEDVEPLFPPIDKDEPFPKRTADTPPETPLPLPTSRNATPLTPADDAPLQGDGTVSSQEIQGRQQPQLTIEKIAPENAILGQPLVYSIIVKNVGKTVASQVVVKDRIPKGTELTGTIPRAELDKTTLLWKLGNLKPGEERKIAVRVTPISEGQVGSIATVNFVAEVASRTQVTASKLKLTLDGPAEARLGDSIVFKFVLKNGGQTDVEGVVLRSIIPKGLSHPAGDDLEYEIGKLTAGDSREINLTMSAAAAGQAINRAVVTAEGGIEVKSATTIDIQASDISVSRKGPAKVYPGKAVVFSNQVTNETNQPLADLTVVETLPEGIEFVEASSGGQYHAAKRTIAWRIERLGMKQSTILQVKVKPSKAGDYESTVQVITKDGEAGKSTSTLNVIGFPVLKVDSSTGDAPISVGEKGTARIVVANQGGAVAKNVRIVISVPAEIEVQSVRGPTDDSRDGDRIKFATIESLAAGEEAVIELNFLARQPTDARIDIAVVADHMGQPLNSQAGVLIVPDGE